MEEFEKLFRIPIFALKIIGLNPYAEKDMKWFIQFIIFHGLSILVFMLVIYNIVYYDIKSNDFSQICKNAILGILYLANAFMCGVLIFHRQSILGLMEDIKKDFGLSKHLPPDEQKVMLDFVKKGVRVCKLWVFIPMISSTLFVLKSFVLFAYYYWIGDFRLVPFYEFKYPGILETNKDDLVVFLLMYGLIFYFGSMSAIMHTAFVPLGPIFMLHACGQLELVKMKLERVFDEKDDRVIKMKFKRIIQQLQYIYGFVERINSSLPVAYELTMKDTTIVLPVTCYELIESLKRGEFSLEFLTFIFSGTLISITPCYYSDVLMEKGEELRQALFCCGWERYYDLRTRTTLLVIMARATGPVAIRAMFRTLCLEALTDLFHQSYAIFNLMNAMWN